MHVQAMIRTHPEVGGKADDWLVACIESCFDCAQACSACADACLGEKSATALVQCIRLNLDCAEICMVSGNLASRRTGSNQSTFRALLTACAEACRRCEEACRAAAGTSSPLQ
jgi:hypothetical protein